MIASLKFMGMLTKKQTCGASVRNYHIARRTAIKDFAELQQSPPIVRLLLVNEFKFVKARFASVNTVADGLANEQLVGRIQSRTSFPRLSKGCQCPQQKNEFCYTCSN